MPAPAIGQGYYPGLTEQQTVTVAPPGAGLTSSIKLGSQLVGDALWWRLVGCTFTLTTDANAANRLASIEYLGGDGVAFMADEASVVVTASTTNQRFIGKLSQGVAEWNTNTDVLFPLSGLWLEAGVTVKLNATNIQVTDAFTVIRYTFDRVTEQQWEWWCRAYGFGAWEGG